MISQTLSTRVLVTETISRHRSQVTHKVSNLQTRIPVNKSRYSNHKITQICVTVPQFTNLRRTRAQPTWWPPRNRISQIARVWNQSRALKFASIVANPAKSCQRAHLKSKQPRHCYAFSRISHLSRNCPSHSRQQPAQPVKSKFNSTNRVVCLYWRGAVALKSSNRQSADSRCACRHWLCVVNSEIGAPQQPAVAHRNKLV